LEDNAWVLVRFSGTEPLLRIYCEANDPDLVQSILDEAQSMLGV
jgi:phosphomannomutase